MMARLGEVTYTIRHFGGLSVFFACYLSVCYAITSYMLVVVPQPSISEEPTHAPITTAQVSNSTAAKAIKGVVFHRPMLERDILSASSARAEHTIRPSLPQTSPASPGQTPPSPTETTPQPPSRSLAHQLQKQQAGIQKLLDSL